jgi:hypothetical protein
MADSGQASSNRREILKPLYLARIMFYENAQVMYRAIGLSRWDLPASKIFLRSVINFNLKLDGMTSSWRLVWN